MFGKLGSDDDRECVMTFWDFLADKLWAVLIIVYLVLSGIEAIVKAWKSGCKCKEEL